MSLVLFGKSLPIYQPNHKKIIKQFSRSMCAHFTEYTVKHITLININHLSHQGRVTNIYMYVNKPAHQWPDTVYPKKYAHGFCFAVLCCGYTLTDFPISIRLTSLALWQSDDCPSASKATLMNMDKYFIWIHYERHNHNKAKHNKSVCIFLGIYCNGLSAVLHQTII